MDDASDPYAAVTAQAVRDPVFRIRLMADPAATLKAAAIGAEPGKKCAAINGTEKPNTPKS